jgi:signal transduction histidine kinase
MTEFDICELIRLVMISLEPEGAKKRIDADLDLVRDRINVVGDKDSIYQVLYNIIQNAIKFANVDSMITISVRDENENEIREREEAFDNKPKIVVSVHNEGIGISKELKTFVFDRFFKADSTRQMDKAGVGLGMYISKTIIDAHKQKIWVDSVEGEWCCFYFTLDKENEKNTQK